MNDDMRHQLWMPNTNLHAFLAGNPAKNVHSAVLSVVGIVMWYRFAALFMHSVGDGFGRIDGATASEAEWV